MLVKPVLEIMLAVKFAGIVTLIMAMLAVLCVNIIRKDPETGRWTIVSPWRWFTSGGGYNPGLEICLMTIGYVGHGVYTLSNMVMNHVTGKDFADNLASIAVFLISSVVITIWRNDVKKSNGKLLDVRTSRYLWLGFLSFAALLIVVILPSAKQTISFDPRISAYLSSHGHE